VATHPEHQGHGVGSFMINEIMNLFPDAVAKVKLDNEASLKLFEKCGFKKRFYLLERD
jgi:ribosomal protein S18 acetylase RimI-like enzyme